jgi:hypothetical protein
MVLSFSLIFFSLSYLWSITLFLSKFIFLQYDCSSADINPIGSLNKQDIREFLRWAAIHLGYSSLADIEAAPPTAELEPIRSDYVQVMLYSVTLFSTYWSWKGEIILGPKEEKIILNAEHNYLR